MTIGCGAQGANRRSKPKQLREFQTHAPFDDRVQLDIASLGEDQKKIAEGRVQEIETDTTNDFRYRPIVLHKGTGEQNRRKCGTNLRTEEIRGEVVATSP